MSRSTPQPLAGALYLYMASLPFETPARGSLPIEVHTATGAVLLLAAVLQPRDGISRPPAAFWWFAGYLYVFTCLGVITEHVGQWLKDGFTFLQVLLLFWVTTTLLRDVRVATRALTTYLGACLLLCVLQQLGITSSVAEVGSVAVRVTALGQNPNTFAHNLVLAMLVLFGLTWTGGQEGRFRKVVALLPAALLAVTMMPTAARGAVLSLGVGLALLLAPASLKTRPANLALGVLALLGLSVAAWRSDGMRDRLIASAETHDMAKREDLFPAAWGMFLEKPLLGWGPVNNRVELVRHVPREALPSRETHNVVLEVLTETGIVGATPFLIGLLLCAVSAWQARHGPFGMLPVALMGSLLVVKMGTAGLGTKTHWVILACAVAWTPARRVAWSRVGRPRVSHAHVSSPAAV